MAVENSTSHVGTKYRHLYGLGSRINSFSGTSIRGWGWETEGGDGGDRGLEGRDGGDEGASGVEFVSWCRFVSFCCTRLRNRCFSHV